MIVVCDINEIWRRKPFAALAGRVEVLGVSPADWLVARRRGFGSSEDAMEVLPVLLPPGWASSTAWLGQRILWKKIIGKCKAVEVLVVTSPHYLPLLERIPESVRTIYYASDDYRSYEGWDAAAAKEKELVQRVDHVFFVSEGLKERARAEYGVDPAKLSVSMNATEERFFPPSGNGPVDPPEGVMPRPVAGVVGGINNRLDFQLLLRCADLPELGTLLLVGPLPEERSGPLEKLLDHPKCVAVGGRPHGTIHQWFQCLDAGLMPYAETELNKHCSPMRLFDHLAGGAPVVATKACGQVDDFRDEIQRCGTDDEFVETLGACFNRPRRDRRYPGIEWKDRAEEMLKVLEGLKDA